MGTRKPAGKGQPASGGTRTRYADSPRPPGKSRKPRSGLPPVAGSTRSRGTAPAGKKIRIRGSDEYYILRNAGPAALSGKRSLARGRAHHHPPGSKHTSVWCETCRTEAPDESEDRFYFVKTGGGKPAPEC